MTPRFAITSAVVVSVLLTAITGDGSSGHRTAPGPDIATVDRATVSAPPRPPSPTSVSATSAPDGTAPEEKAPEEKQCDLRASLHPQAPLPAPGQMPADSKMAEIAQRGQLIVGVGPDGYLLSFRDPDDTRALRGFEIDIVQDIAESIFGTQEDIWTKVRFRQVNLTERAEVVRSGDVDLVISTTTITCQRRTEVAFSRVYYEAGQQVLVNRDSGISGRQDLGGRRVCAARGSTSLEEILATRPQPVPVGVPSATDCLILLQLGQVAAVSTDDTLLAGMAAQDPRTKIVGERFTEEPYGILINRDSPDLVRFVNAVLDRRLADGSWLASYQTWLSEWLGAPTLPAREYPEEDTR